MALSRRKVALYMASRLHEGDSIQTVARSIAAYLDQTKSRRSADVLLKEIQRILSENYDHTYLTMFSAQKLDQAVQKELVRTFAHTKSVEIVEQIDPEIIGGVVVETPGHEFDASIASKIKMLKAV